MTPKRIATTLAKIRALAESLDQDDGSEFSSLMANIESAVDQALVRVHSPIPRTEEPPCAYCGENLTTTGHSNTCPRFEN